MQRIPSCDPMDEGFHRLKYFRYADDFIVGVIGGKSDAVKIKRDIKTFLQEKLKLELSDEKTLITHGQDRVKFLGYEIYVAQDSNSTRRNVLGIKQRNISGHVMLSVPMGRIERFLKSKKALGFEKNGNWVSIHRKGLNNLSDAEIIEAYNSEIRGLYKYFNLAYDASQKLHTARHIMKYSCLKTLANKHKSSTRKLLRSEAYRLNGNFGAYYRTKSGMMFKEFHNAPLTRQEPVWKDIAIVDMIQGFVIGNKIASLEQRMSTNKCEWCGRTDSKFEVHHIRKLKDLKGRKAWERVIFQGSVKRWYSASYLMDKVAITNSTRESLIRFISIGEPYTGRPVSTVRGKELGNLYEESDKALGSHPTLQMGKTVAMMDLPGGLIWKYQSIAPKKPMAFLFENVSNMARSTRIPYTDSSPPLRI